MALRNVVGSFPNQGAEDLLVVVGYTTSPDRLLEVGLIVDEIDPRVIHAMPARRQYRERLPEP